MGRKKKSSKSKKWGILLVIEIVLILILVPVLFIFAKLSAINTADDVDKMNVLINDIDTSCLKGYTNIALFGLDTRESGTLEGESRSDSIIIMSINHETKQVKLLSVYRDLCLKVPGYGLTKVNHAYAYGGAELAMSTLNTNLDLNITEFATVDFGVLANIIDAVGGIEIDITEEELSVINPLIKEQNKATGSKSRRLKKAGYQTLNGTQATAYARIRKIDSDFKRAERQRIVLAKLIEKLKSSSLSTLLEVIDEVLPQIYTNLSTTEILALAKDAGVYNIAESKGFPFDVIIGTLYTDNLSYDFANGFNDNVTELHKYLFENEEYTPSQTVQTIGDEIYNSRAS